MCLITESEKEVAQEDIIVYKLITKIGRPVYFTDSDFVYKEGETHTTEILPDNIFVYFDCEDSDAAIDRLGGKATSYGQGFHFAFEKHRLNEVFSSRKNYCNLVECIVPKGAEFYRNPSGLGVTNSIKIVRTLAE